MKRLFALIALGIVIAACGDSGAGAETAAGGPSEAIQVHGHWTIDILNPDGTLDQRVEFENDLSATGSDFLVQSLAGAVPPGDWVVFLGALDNPIGPVPGIAPCAFTKSSFVGTNPDHFQLLTTGCAIHNESVPSPDEPGLSSNLAVTAGTALSLAGSVVATQDGGSAFVETIASVGLGSDFFSFTGQATGTVDVLSGQTIEVTVDISFS